MLNLVFTFVFHALVLFGALSAIVGVFFLKHIPGPLGMFLNASSYGLWFVLDYLLLAAVEKRYKISIIPTGEAAEGLWVFPLACLLPYLCFYMFAVGIVH